MKKHTLMTMLLILGVNLTASDYAVHQGAFAGRANSVLENVTFRGAERVGDFAGRKIDRWTDNACYKLFGIGSDKVADKIGTALLIAIITYGVYKTGQYFVYRETNASKVMRAMSLWQKMNFQLSVMNSLEDIQNFLNEFSFLEVNVHNSYKELNARYGSWIKPWNWTDDMKQAFEKMQIVSLLFYHQDFLKVDYIDPQESLSVARGLSDVQTAYPLCVYVDKTIQQINLLNNLITKYPFASLVSRRLNSVLKAIKSTVEYTEERHRLNIAIACERAAAAAELRNSRHFYY